MKTVAVTHCEGGEWKEFDRTKNRPRGFGLGSTVHAIQFDNGMVWDAVNGFRGMEGKNMRLVVRVPMRRRKLRKRRLPDGSFHWAR